MHASHGIEAGEVCHPSGPPCLPSPTRSKERAETFDFVVIATGLFSIPSRPEWAQGLVSASPPASGPWIVDVKDFTEDKLPLVKVREAAGLGSCCVQLCSTSFAAPIPACSGTRATPDVLSCTFSCTAGQARGNHRSRQVGARCWTGHLEGQNWMHCS